MSNKRSKKNSTQAEAVETVVTETADAETVESEETKSAEEKKEKANSKILEWIKNNKALDALILFAIFELAVILVGILAMKEPVVPVCLIVIGAAGIAALMHNVELWIHGVVVLVELISGILISRIPLMVLCIVVYIVTIATLKYYYMERNK
ncbi:MAG: hypothetical protein PUF45_01710 [Lachnospiraceae bacterium]|nr:hypothetical protein [Lachnospiraceae bacterium]